MTDSIDTMILEKVKDYIDRLEALEQIGWIPIDETEDTITLIILLAKI